MPIFIIINCFEMYLSILAACLILLLDCIIFRRKTEAFLSLNLCFYSLCPENGHTFFSGIIDQSLFSLLFMTFWTFSAQIVTKHYF